MLQLKPIINGQGHKLKNKSNKSLDLKWKNTLNDFRLNNQHSTRNWKEAPCKQQHHCGLKDVRNVFFHSEKKSNCHCNYCYYSCCDQGKQILNHLLGSNLKFEQLKNCVKMVHLICLAVWLLVLIAVNSRLCANKNGTDKHQFAF